MGRYFGRVDRARALVAQREGQLRALGETPAAVVPVDDFAGDGDDAVDQSPLMTLQEVLQLLGVSASNYYERRKAGTWPIPEVRPRLWRGPRFYRAHVLALMRGELVALRGGKR